MYPNWYLFIILHTWTSLPQISLPIREIMRSLKYIPLIMFSSSILRCLEATVWNWWSQTTIHSPKTCKVCDRSCCKNIKLCLSLKIASCCPPLFVWSWAGFMFIPNWALRSKKPCKSASCCIIQSISSLDTELVRIASYINNKETLCIALIRNCDFGAVILKYVYKRFRDNNWLFLPYQLLVQLKFSTKMVESNVRSTSKDRCVSQNIEFQERFVEAGQHQI